jgi:hypothetical protein
MKKYIILFLLMFAVQAHAGGILMMGGKAPTAAAKYCDGKSVLACEDLEGSSSCYSGYSSNCRSAVSDLSCPSGTIAFNSTPIEGTYSLLLTPNTTNYCIIEYAFTAFSPFYIAYVMKTPASFALDTYENSMIAILYDSPGGSNLCNLAIYKDGAGNHYWSVTDGSGNTTGNVAITTATTYYHWLEYTKGAGNGVCNLYVSANTTKPGSATVSVTNGTSNSNIGALVIGAMNNHLSSLRVDNIQVNSSAIGNQ